MKFLEAARTVGEKIKGAFGSEKSQETAPDTIVKIEGSPAPDKHQEVARTLREKIKGLFTLPKPSEDLQALYDRLPALNRLAKSHYWIGLFRGLVEIAVSTRLLMNLPEIGVLSQSTASAVGPSGEKKGEADAMRSIAQNVDPKTPAHQVKSIEAQIIRFIDSAWEPREELETHLNEEHFKTEAQFEANVLQKVDKMSGILKRNLGPDEQARELANLFFGEKKINLMQHPELEELLKKQKPLNPDAIEQSLKDFYGKISGLAPSASVKDRLWTRKRYADLIKGLVGVAEHGYYEEMDEDLLILKGAENALRDVKLNRKLSLDDIKDLVAHTRRYETFLRESQTHSFKGGESLGIVSKAFDSIRRKQPLDEKSKYNLRALVDLFVSERHTLKQMHGMNGPESKMQLDLVKNFMKHCVEGNEDPEPTIGILQEFMTSLDKTHSAQIKQKIATLDAFLKYILTIPTPAHNPKNKPKPEADFSDEIDELSRYIDTHRKSMRSAGVSEKKIYLPLATARKQFLDTPVEQHIREINREEIDSIMEQCFGQSKTAKRNEIISHVLQYGMLGVSRWIPGIFGGNIANALGWGVAIGSRAYFESYNVVKGARLMSNAVAEIFVNGFGNKKGNIASLINEHDSRSSQFYYQGYTQAMVTALPANYIGAITGAITENSWASYITVIASLPPFILSYFKWYKSVGELRAQIYKNIKVAKGPSITSPGMPAVQLPGKSSKRTISLPEMPALQIPEKSKKP